MMTTTVQPCSATCDTNKPNKKNRTGVYFYGIVAARQHRDFGEIGVGGKPVYTVCYNDIAAVVSEAAVLPPDGRVAKDQFRGALKRIRSQADFLPMNYREHLALSDVKQILTVRYTHLKIQLARRNGGTELKTPSPDRQGSLVSERRPKADVHR